MLFIPIYTKIFLHEEANRAVAQMHIHCFFLNMEIPVFPAWEFHDFQGLRKSVEY